MNFGGFRYTLETQHKGKWCVNISTDDRALVEKFYDKALETNPKRPARVMDRSIGTALRYYTGPLKTV